MAGDWIKMRGVLCQHPKVAAMARKLMGNRDFREWVQPGGSGPMNECVLSDGALRCVVTALLLRTWSCARAVGTPEESDLFLPSIRVVDVDAMAGVDGFAEAMESVGWLRARGSQGVILPRFMDNNAPMESAERQAAYRERKRNETLRNVRNAPLRDVAPREEKRRVEKKEEKTKDKEPPAPPVPPALASPEFERAWADWQQHRREIKKPLKPTMIAAQLRAFEKMGTARAIAAIDFTIEKGWQGIREPDIGHVNGFARPETPDLRETMK